jgi:hypothetical protein
VCDALITRDLGAAARQDLEYWQTADHLLHIFGLRKGPAGRLFPDGIDPSGRALIRRQCEEGWLDLGGPVRESRERESSYTQVAPILH